jgi:hypothetical protein
MRSGEFTHAGEKTRTGPPVYRTPHYSAVPRKKGSAALWVALILFLAALGAAAWYFLGPVYREDTPGISPPENRQDAPPASSRTAPQETRSIPSEETASPAVVADPAYEVFEDAQYNTYCAYPSHFIKQSTASAGTRLSLISPDGKTVMRVLASDNSAKITVQDAMREFADYIGGDVTYQASGSVWYAMTIKKEGRAYYRKCFVEERDIRCFEFICPDSELPVYDGYINYIEDRFGRR